MAEMQEAVRRLRIESSIEGVDQTVAGLKSIGDASDTVVSNFSKVEEAYARLQQQQSQYKAANDNLAQNMKAANDNFQDFGKSLASRAVDFLNDINHLKLLALAAYAVSPAFRSFANTEISAGLQLIGVHADLLARAVGAIANVAAPALRFFGSIAIPITIAVAAWKGLNAIIDTGSSLLEKYGNAGRALFDSGVNDNLAKLTKFQNETISQQQVQNATELGARLAVAKRTLDDFFKVQFDLTAPALALQAAWVSIVEMIAKAVDLAGRLPSKLPTIQGDPNLIVAGTTGGGLPAPGQPDSTKGNFDINSNFTARKLAYSRLTAQMGGGFAGRFSNAINDLANPPKPEEAQSTNAYDRAIQQVRDQIDLLKLEAEGAGKTSEAYQELKVAHELNIAAMKAGITPTDEMRDEWKKLADQIAAATVALNQNKVLLDQQFKGATQFMSSSDAAAANAAHQIDPTNWTAHLNDAGPKLAAFNDQLKQASDLSFNFVDTFNQGLLQGQTRIDSFKNALHGLESQLLQMAEKQAINSLFSSLFKLFAPGAGAGGPTNVVGGAGSMPVPTFSAMGNVFHGGNVVPFANGGIVSQPTFFPMANGGVGVAGEAGDDEGILPLKRINGKLGVHASGGGQPVTLMHETHVHNYNSDNQISQRSERGPNGMRTMIEIVKKDYARGGFDGPNSALYGMRRNKVRSA